MKKCYFCENNKPIFNEPNSPSLSMIIPLALHKKTAIVRLEGNNGKTHDFIYTLNYCPICGNKFNLHVKKGETDETF